MKYRIDAVVGPTEGTLAGYNTSPDEDKTTTVATDVEGLTDAHDHAVAALNALVAADLPVHGVYVINDTMNIVSTLTKEDPNG